MSTKNLLKLGDPRSNPIFDQFKDKKQFLTAWNEMMFVIEHIERMQTTGVAATEEAKKINSEHHEKLSNNVADETDRRKRTKKTAALADTLNHRRTQEPSTAMQRNNTEPHQQRMQTRATAAKNVETKTHEKKNTVVAASNRDQSKETDAKNKIASENQKIIAANYPIIVLHKLPDIGTAAEIGNKKGLIGKQSTAISTRTRQQTKSTRK